MNLALIFLSRTLFPPLFFLLGCCFLIFGYNKKYYEDVSANIGVEHANRVKNILRISGPIMLVCSIIMSLLIDLK
jgi:hypothetical protein